MMKLSGYPRPDGSIGFRNRVAVLTSVGCANDLANRLGRMYPDVLVLTHRQGCSQLGRDNDQTFRTLAGLGKNPNVAAVLVVGLGCETIPAEKLAHEISKTKKPVEYLNFLDDEGLLAALPKGAKILERMLQEASQIKRVPCTMEQLTLGLKCGLSDTTSGIASNPATGVAADRVVDSGGTVIFTETPELIGAEHIVAGRAASREVEEKLYRVVEEFKERAEASDLDLQEANVAPGNIAGGLTTIEEKSLGSIMKAGKKTLQGVLGYGEIPEGQGLFFMDGPGRTPEALTGLNAAGAQIIIFPTGGGSPGGSPISPVIKVTGNPETARRLRDHIDVDVTSISRGEESLQAGGERIFQKLVDVAFGEMTKAEALGYGSVSIWNIGVLCG
ncbi:MAG: UxaA family hydrolase [Deltaproteobacteria bacterium]|nr:UxaA family hydrolase [Deltaproteobacteria bacterium]MBW2120324.1 UxaA family hydrolase [Deltaproteobacteria bacterium]